jgi:hypothetical protein
MEYTFLQVVCPVLLAEIAAMRQFNQDVRTQEIQLVKNTPDVEEAFFYTSGGLAYVVLAPGAFNKEQWKKAKGGHLPKVRTPFALSVKAIPSPKLLMDAVKHLGFGIIGKTEGRATITHSTVMAGHGEVGALAQFYYLRVPHSTDELLKAIPEQLKKIPEWAALKGVSDLVEAQQKLLVKSEESKQS